MPTQQLDHAHLSRLAVNGRITATHIVAHPGGWAIQVDINDQEHILTAQRSGNVRLFRRFETLVGYLHALGIEHFQVDSSTWGRRDSSAYQRPDRAEALKRMHEAAAYDAWFTDQVEASLNDPAPALDDAAVEQLFAAQRAQLKSKR